VILNIDNEFMTFKLMDEIKSIHQLFSFKSIEYYEHNANALPKRHYYNRFVKDMKQWSLPYVDFMHFTIPLDPANVGGFKFPGEYVGQYGVYDAVKHLY
jgi:hypothetical protein